VRLIGEPRIARDLAQWTALVNPVSCELESTHQEIAMRAGPEQDSELAAQVIARQPGDRLQLRRMHHTRPLGVQKPPSTFNRRDVNASREFSRGTRPFSRHQSFREVHDEAIDSQRFERHAKRSLDRL
jgi:hypothetical protein